MKREYARLFLETRNGGRFLNFSAQLPAGCPVGAAHGEERRKCKSPSSRRRDLARLEAWKKKKNISDAEEGHSVHEDSVLDNQRENHEDEIKATGDTSDEKSNEKVMEEKQIDTSLGETR